MPETTPLIIAAAFAGLLLLVMLMLLVAGGVAQAQIQPLESIQAAAEKEVRGLLPPGKATYHVSASRLDPRLRQL